MLLEGYPTYHRTPGGLDSLQQSRFNGEKHHGMRHHRPCGSVKIGPAQGARWEDTRSSSDTLASYTRASHAHEKHQDCLPWKTAAARARALLY